MRICVSKLTIIGLDNGLSPYQHKAIIWTNAEVLTGLLGTNFNEFFIKIDTFLSKEIHLKMSSGKWQPFFLGLNVLNSKHITYHKHILCYLMKSSPATSYLRFIHIRLQFINQSFKYLACSNMGAPCCACRWPSNSSSTHHIMTDIIFFNVFFCY